MAPKFVDLVPFDPDDELHVKELTRQRILCGWNVDAVDGWLIKIRKGDKGLQWIFRSTTPEAAELFKTPLPDEEMCNLDLTVVGPPRVDPAFAPIGHVSLDWVDEVDGQTEPELANRTRGIATISSFFILMSQQGLGLGNIVMDELEALAGTSAFNAKVITLNTLDRDEATNPERWTNMSGGYVPTRRVNEDWYARRGYAVFRRAVPRYRDRGLDGNMETFNAVYMRKDVVPS